MKKIVLVLILFVLSVPIFADNLRNLSSPQQQFVDFIVPKINAANYEVLALRKQLVYLHNIWQAGKPLSAKQKQWLDKLAHDYKITNVNFAQQQTWDELLKRVDALPGSLILAQAINESAWGHSRFAYEGNNYFGQWCTRPGCGIVPQKRPEGANYEVRKYATPIDSVKSYIFNVNTNRSYRTLRNLRYQQRRNHKMLEGLVLVQGMQHYSQYKDTYVKMLQDIIQEYNLSQLDQI